MLLTSCWINTLAVGQNSLSQTLQQVKQDWDEVHPTQQNPPVAPASGIGDVEGNSMGPSTFDAIFGSTDPAI